MSVRAAKRIRALRRDAAVAPLQLVGVLVQREVERLAQRIGDLAGRGVGALRVEVAVVPEHVVGAEGRAAPELAVDPGGVFEDVGRYEVPADLRRHAGNIGLAPQRQA